MGLEKKVLAFDAGGGSTRISKIGFDGSRLTLEQIARFPNGPVSAGGNLYWDILGIWRDLLDGLRKAAGEDSGIVSLGIDTWGNDFVLLDRQGCMLENPYTYRDSRTSGLVDEVGRLIGDRELYFRNGIQLNRMNTLYQLFSLSQKRPYILDIADRFLFIADLLAYYLTGELKNEYTMATISQLYSYSRDGWDHELMELLGIPARIFCPVIKPGEIIGSISDKVCREAGIAPLKLTAVAAHDTGSAVVAVPAEDGPPLYISSGTWSIVGTETDAPVINSEAYDFNCANEGGANGKIRLLKNVMGLWIIQEIRRNLAVRGMQYTYDDLNRLAEEAEPFAAMIDPDDELFYEPSDMPQAIREYCSRTGQRAPEDTGSLVRTVLESLAFKYRYVIEGLERITGRTFDRIHIVGGGSINTLLNAFTANCCGRPVYAGPQEATTLGNGIVQMISLGEISDYSQARSIVKKSFPPQEFMPCDTQRWDEAYRRFVELIRE
ncbi:MAG TPA: rhamnulokinase family protein [Clostridiales bacterium]|nr:rhamnulokinase family protein [Clostridiales bacterium]HPV02538.1 rhamnulokinase family protein [Clostridiales bacterium]